MYFLFHLEYFLFFVLFSRFTGQKKHWKQHKEEHWRICRKDTTNKDLICGLCSIKVEKDNDDFFRLNCCGRLFHDGCVEDRSNCPSCNMIVPEKGSANEIEVLREWVAKNKAWAQYALGDRYQDGHGVEKSLDKALQLYETSAKQNYGSSQAEMWRLLVLQQKYGLAFYWAEKLANNEEAASKTRGRGCYNLAAMNAQGLGVETSPDNARIWLKQAVKYGDEKHKKKSLDLLELLGVNDKLTDMQIKKCASCNAAEQLPQRLSKCSNCKIT